MKYTTEMILWSIILIGNPHFSNLLDLDSKETCPNEKNPISMLIYHIYTIY